MKKYYKRVSQWRVEEHVLLTLSEFQPMNHLEYAEISNLSTTSAFGRFDGAHEKRLIHVAMWKRNHVGPPIPYYSIGDYPDAKRPDPYTTSEKCKRWRQTEHGKKSSRKAAKRWKNSAAGKKYRQNYSIQRTTKKQLAEGRLHAIDPLLAVFYK